MCGAEELKESRRVVTISKLDDGRGTRTLRGLNGQIEFIRFSRDSRRVAALAHTWRVGIWNVASGRLLHILEVPKGYYADNVGFAFSPDGRRFAFAAGTRAKLWDLTTGALLATWKLPPGLQDTVAFHASGKLLLIRYETKQGKLAPFSEADPKDHPRVIRVRDLLGPNPEKPIREVTYFNQHVYRIIAPPDGRNFVVWGTHRGPDGNQQLVRGFETLSNREPWSNTDSGVSPTDPTGQWLLVGANIVNWQPANSTDRWNLASGSGRGHGRRSAPGLPNTAGSCFDAVKRLPWLSWESTAGPILKRVSTSPATSSPVAIPTARSPFTISRQSSGGWPASGSAGNGTREPARQSDVDLQRSSANNACGVRNVTAGDVAMNGFVFHIVSGQSFFSGALLITLAAFFSTRKTARPRRLATLLFIVGLLGVILSSTPLPYWYYGVAAAVTVAWFISAFRERWRRPTAIAVALAWVIAAAIEAPRLLAPNLRPARSRSVTIIGDSVTALPSEDNAPTWPRILADQHNLEVQDISHDGETAASALKRARTHAIGAPIVLVEIGGNDLLGSTSSARFSHDLDALLAYLKAPGRQVVMFELPLPPFYQEYGRIQRTLAIKYDVALIPKRIFLGVLAGRDATVDTIHLSGVGHQRMALCVWQLLSSALEEAR